MPGCSPNYKRMAIHYLLVSGTSALTQNILDSELLVIILGYAVFGFRTVLRGHPRAEEELLGTSSPTFCPIPCFHQSNRVFICLTYYASACTFFWPVGLNGFSGGGLG